MADIKNYPVSKNFDLQNLIAELTMAYQQKGYITNLSQNNYTFSLDIRKDNDGIKKIFGLSTGLRANFILNNGVLQVALDEHDWLIKTVVTLVGFFTSFAFISLAFLVTGAIGLYRQYDLGKSFDKDLYFIISALSSQYVEGQEPAYQQTPYRCQNCNSPLNIDARFCPECGRVVN